MKKYETFIKSITDTRIVEHNCDICGKPAAGSNGRGDWPSPDEPDNDYRGVDIKIEMEDVAQYPGEEGVYIDTEIDLCPSCFTDKLVPWIKSLNPGFEPLIKKYDV